MLQTPAARRAAISLHGFLRRDQHLAAHVPAFLDRSELILEMHPGGTGADHRFHQFEGVEYAAETGFGIGDDGGVVVDEILMLRIDALGALDGRRGGRHC